MPNRKAAARPPPGRRPCRARRRSAPSTTTLSLRALSRRQAGVVKAADIVVVKAADVVEAAAVVVVSAGNVPAAGRLLTTIRHHLLRTLPLPLAAPLLGHLLLRRRVREAASIIHWLCRPDSPQRPNSATFTFAVAADGHNSDNEFRLDWTP
ncbi:hypothetical protein DAI22_06g149050 [Oryza sativa Japonica Group]|nr:hypothetical protein DAI22_06g149050 [Oryza sativa Japonica Group]